MGYKVEYDTLDGLYNGLSAQANQWLERFQSLQTAVEVLSGSKSISGTGADSIRSYFENVHGTIIGLLASLVSLHSANCLLYKQDYQQNIDQDLHSIIHETELNQIKRSIQNNKTLALTVNGEVQYALEQVRDIFYFAYRDASDVEVAHKTIEDFLDDLDTEIKNLEQRHSTADFTNSAQMIMALKAFISEQAGKDRTYKETFAPADLANSSAFQQVYGAYVSIQDELDDKANAIETAIGNENQRIADLQAEYEERQKKATIINWVVTGVCIIGSIAAIAATGGAATPLVVAGISAASSAVIAGTHNVTGQYVQNGSLSNLDLKSLGKDVVVGAATGFVTGYLGSTVSGAITSGLGNTALGSTLLNSSNAAVRIGTGAVIGSASQVGSGIVSRGAGTLVSTGGDIDTAINEAFNLNNIAFDAAMGGITGGISRIKNPNASKYDNAISDGSQFDENGNLKPNTTYKTGEHDYYYSTNDEGHIVEAHADNLQLKTHEGRLQHNPNTPGKEAGDQAGHLIGDRFGGSPDLDNLTSQNARLNQSDYKMLENEWANAIENGHEVSVDINVDYGTATTGRPISYDVSYSIDGEWYNIKFPNP